MDSWTEQNAHTWDNRMSHQIGNEIPSFQEFLQRSRSASTKATDGCGEDADTAFFMDDCEINDVIQWNLDLCRVEEVFEDGHARRLRKQSEGLRGIIARSNKTTTPSSKDHYQSLTPCGVEYAATFKDLPSQCTSHWLNVPDPRPTAVVHSSSPIWQYRSKTQPTIHSTHTQPVQEDSYTIIPETDVETTIAELAGAMSLLSIREAAVTTNESAGNKAVGCKAAGYNAAVWVMRTLRRAFHGVARAILMK